MKEKERQSDRIVKVWQASHALFGTRLRNERETERRSSNTVKEKGRVRERERGKQNGREENDKVFCFLKLAGRCLSWPFTTIGLIERPKLPHWTKIKSSLKSHTAATVRSVLFFWY